MFASDIERVLLCSVVTDTDAHLKHLAEATGN